MEGPQGVAELLSLPEGVAESAWALPSVMVATFFLLRLLQWWLQEAWTSSRVSAKQLHHQCAPGAPPILKQRALSGAAARHDAPLCWSQGFGRYKYCGLRPDPFASTEPPAYSLANLDIPLPELGEEERQALDRLASRVGDLEELARRGPGLGGHRTDRSTLLRFLRARKGDVARAEALLREAARWRQSVDADHACSHWDLEAYERCLAPWWLSGGFAGFGKRGELVAIERFGACHCPNLFKAVPFEVLLRIDVLHAQRSLAALEEEALRRGGPMAPVIVVLDLNGFGWDQIKISSARALGRLAYSRNLMLTETTGRILMVNAPAAFSRAWSLFSYLLDPGVREKTVVCSGHEKSLEVLRRYIDDDALPAFLCGRKTVEGDPDCSRLLAPGGQPPQEAIDRLLALTTRDGAVLPAAKAGGDARGAPRAVGEEGELRRRGRSCCGM